MKQNSRCSILFHLLVPGGKWQISYCKPTRSYLANSPLISQITYQQNSATRMTTTKQYDYLNRLTQISSSPGAAYTLPLTYNYSYNSANQRTKDTLADGSYWVYGYNWLGQVTNVCKYFATGAPVPGQQFDYAFDTIGNRTQTMSGGDTYGANLRVANYTANNLNQITSRDIPAYVDIMGASILTNTVTVNGQTAYRNQEYYRQQLAANNGTSALWTNITVAGGQTVTGNVYVPKEPESFSYDLDGNLLSDGSWAYTWDAENRLVGMTNNTGVGPLYGLGFAYDPKGRRIQKIVATNNGTAYIGQSTNTYLYDNWNLIALFNSSFILHPSSFFMWGSDLSGSMQGAGGVGGLLEVSYYGSSTTNCFPAFDGNGNLSALINSADGTLAANYEYGPFGEVIRATGPMAKVNPVRFSTKYQDDESDLLYYGFRYYKPSTGTWLSRDPINEIGFDSLYGNLIHKRKSNSEIANEYLAKLFLNKPYLRQTLEPVVSRINWDAVNIPSDESKPIGDGNIYEFVNNNSVNAYDYLGLAGSWFPLIDVQICLINVEPGSGLTFPPAIIFGFTPQSKPCSRYLAKKCCQMAQTTFDSVYNGVPGTPGTGYAVSLAAAAAVFNSCVNLGY